MGKREQPRDGFEEVDEYSAPTEPMMPVVLSPFSSTIPDPAAPTVDGTLPTPQPQERPFPQQDGLPFSQSFHRPPASSSYPFLPPAPPVSGRPPGGAIPIRPAGPTRPVQAQPRRSSLPQLVGLFFVLVQLLLLMRFVLQFVGMAGTSWWVNTIYIVSGAFILPFRLLLEQTLHLDIEFYTLVAILVYGLLSRLLVRFLKALLHSR